MSELSLTDIYAGVAAANVSHSRSCALKGDLQRTIKLPWGTKKRTYLKCTSESSEKAMYEPR